MNDKKRFPNERPDDVDKVLTDSLSDICFIKHIIRFTSDFDESPTIIYSVDSKYFKLFLERIAKSLELLSGYITEELELEIEALSGDLTESYDTNRELHEKYKKLKAEKEYLEDDKLRVVDECVKRDKEITRLKNLLDTSIKNTDIWMKSYFSAHKEREELREKFANSEKMLKSAVSKIDEVINERLAVNRWIPCIERLPEQLQNVIVCTDINTVTVAWLNGDHWTFADTGGGHTENWSFDAVKYWMYLPEKCEELREKLEYEHCGSNFCGNCRYCVQLMTGEYACRMPVPDRIIDPDDSSCQYFKQPYDTRTDQEVCATCAKKDDPDYCNHKCPLYPF